MEAARSVGGTAPLKRWLDELLVVALLVVALVIGWAMKGWLEGQTIAFTSEDGLLGLRYPADWLEQIDKEALLSVSDIRGEGAFKPMFSVTTKEMDPDFPLTLNDLVLTMSLRKAEELTAYRILSTDSGTLDGVEAAKVSYAYVAEPTGGVQQSVPVVVEAVDWVAIHQSNAYVLTFAAMAANFDQEAGTFNSILATVDFK